MRIIYIYLMTFFIVSCATQHITSSLNEEDALSERVKLFWEAKQKNDWNAVKEFVDPDLREEIIPYLDSLKNKLNMSEIISYNIEELRIDGGNATVITKVTIKLTHPFLGSPRILEQTVRDEWVKRGSSWYMMMVKPDLAKTLEDFLKRGKEVNRKGGD